jgi:membrane protein implicated in regulation of membrane protease activity
MDWNAPTMWWVAAGVLVAVELVSGTFYLLMLAAGAVAGALAAHLGLGHAGQLVTAALVGGGAVVAWHLGRSRRGAGAPAQANRDVNLDIGERVHVDTWSAEGEARVMYRGASWSARYGGKGDAQPGTHVIHAIEGSLLVLHRAAA